MERPQRDPGNSQSNEVQQQAGTNGRGAPTRFWQRVAFWRALAGVGFALAIAGAIVSAEFSSILIHRTHLLSRRISHLKVETRRVRRELSRTNHHLAAIRESAANAAALNHLLTAPDVRLIALAAGNAGARSASSSVGHNEPKSAAVIAASDARKSAMLQAENLPPSPRGSVYRVWWIPRHGSPVAAGKFTVGADGDATVKISPAPSPDAAVAIYQQAADAANAPGRAPILKSAAVRRVTR